MMMKRMTGKANKTTVLSVKYGGDTMDNKLTMLKYVEYCTDKREEAYKEYAKYNGFTSQTSETMRENNLDYMQMAAMAEFTKESAEFWNKKCDEAIEEFENLFDSREEAKEYCREH